MTEFGNWIKNADTKISVLAAVFGVMLALLAARADTFRRVLADPASCATWILVALLMLLLGAVLMTTGLLYSALVPRTVVTGRNRFSWPSIASEPQPPRNLDQRSTLEEAWSHNHLLAQIAGRKYAAFRNALRGFVITLILGIACVVIATWQSV
ncbi:hypothetical protein [Nocardia sp. NPDC052566]|uniref:hypothetical protein n=1 Tax=Nocardia sp. NPDC052566 TaxID=3364330 RepID=UPI0037C70C02